ncbi:MAG: sigma factor-like helix-turn-helix DNA-binding protein [Elusimicrobiota bacterium]|jgi:hypothetical protein
MFSGNETISSVLEMLSVRTTRAVRRGKLRTLGQLLQMSPSQLMEIDGFGKACLKEVEESLAEYALHLAPEPVRTKRNRTGVPGRPRPSTVIKLLLKALGRLDARQRLIIKGRHGQRPLTLEQLAKRLAISRERVRQLQNKTERSLLKRFKGEVIERAICQLREHQSCCYTPNQGGIPTLDGDLRLIERYGTLLNKLASMKNYCGAIYFDPLGKKWQLLAPNKPDH